MLKWEWLRGEPEPAEGALVGFQRQMLLALAAITFYGTWSLLFWVPRERTANNAEMGLIMLGSIVAGLVLLLRKRRPRLACWFLLTSGLLLTSLAFLLFSRPVILSFFAVHTLVAGLLLGPWASAVAGVLGTGLTISLQPYLLLTDTGPFWICLIVIGALLGALAGRALRLADYWERQTVVQQREYIEQLRDRQGTLNRTLKALDEAYESLKRSNEELVIAREAAEEARVFKEQFVANISHELRTPLNLIVGFAEMIYLSPEIYGPVNWTPALAGDIEEIYRASRHLQSLVDDILDLSRIDASRLPMFRELQDIRVIIAEAAETVSALFRQRGLAYHAEWPAELPCLFVDRTRIRQVMINLFNNAVRHTEQGSITVRVTQESDALVVSVQDTGSGIPPHQLEAVFERFHQVEGGLRRRNGAGLGLTLSRRFVELHGGRMWVESEVGRGSTFHFALPLPGALPQSTPLYRTPESRQPEEARPVVVLDPDPALGEMLSRYLGDRRVLAGANLEEVEALIEAEHPQAVIVNLPPETAGPRWLGPLTSRSRLHGVPVLRCSLASASWLGADMGLDGCLNKPVSRAALGSVLERHHIRQGRILVVDDDEAFIRLMERMLRILAPEAEVLSASSGRQALRLAAEKRPSLVLLDLVMPEMDGFAVLQALRSDPTLADTAVVAVTATSYNEEALQQRGTYLTLTQPYGLAPGALVELLNAVLSVVKPQYAGEPAALGARTGAA